MGLPVTIYRSSDAGAPQLGTRKPSEMINILKKCLVDGYGAKVGAGWTIPFVDLAANNIVFRNSPVNGSGSYLNLWAKTAGDVGNDMMFMQAAPFIDSLNPDWSLVAGATYRNIFCRGQPTHTRWSLYATSACFYLVTYGALTPLNSGGQVAGTTTYMPTVFCGDYINLTPGDLQRFIIIGTDTSGGDVSLTSDSNPDALNRLTAGAPIFRLYETQSLSAPKQGCILVSMPSGLKIGYGTTAVPATPDVGMNMTFIPLLIGLTDAHISSEGTAAQYIDSANVNTCRSMLQPIVRGVLPGLHMSVFFGCASQNNIFSWVADGVTWDLLPQFHFGGSRVWLKASGEWYA